MNVDELMGCDHCVRFPRFIKKALPKKDFGWPGMEKNGMNKVTVQIQGYDVDFDSAQQMAQVLAERDNEMTTLVSWNDAKRNIHSPQCLQCEIKGEPGWEVYGRNHEGRLRISFNDDTFVFIYT